jgi:hypothetical protein
VAPETSLGIRKCIWELGDLTDTSLQV